MAKAGQRKCMSCGEFFIPDHRNGERQRYCSRCRLPAREQGRQPGRLVGPAVQQRLLQRPRTRRARAGLARRASGLQPRQGSAVAGVTRSLDRRKCLMRLRNVPIVLRLPSRPRAWRYKIS